VSSSCRRGSHSRSGAHHDSIAPDSRPFRLPARALVRELHLNGHRERNPMQTMKTTMLTLAAAFVAAGCGEMKSPTKPGHTALTTEQQSTQALLRLVQAGRKNSTEGLAPTGCYRCRVKPHRSSSAWNRASARNGSHMGSTGRKTRFTSRTAYAFSSAANTPFASFRPALTAAIS
jgi:hypothetical protein